jgi:hypothetical protein
MRLNHVSIAVVLCAVAIAAVSGCSSSPKANPDAKPVVNARLAPENDLFRHGVGNAENPFIVPARISDALFAGGRKEFVVLAVDLTLPKAEQVSIEANVKDTKGDIVARLFSKEDLYDFWKKVYPRDDPSLSKCLMVIDWYYPPSSEFKAKSGHREYFVACVGKAPIARPATAELSVAVGEDEPQFFTFDLLPSKKQ